MNVRPVCYSFSYLWQIFIFYEEQFVAILQNQVSQTMRKGCWSHHSHGQTLKTHVSLHICAVSPEPLLFAHMIYGPRQSFRQRALDSRTDRDSIWWQFRDNFHYFSIKTYVVVLIRIASALAWVVTHECLKDYKAWESCELAQMRRLMTKPIKWPVRPPKTQISLDILPVLSESSLCA